MTSRQLSCIQVICLEDKSVYFYVWVHPMPSTNCGIIWPLPYHQHHPVPHCICFFSQCNTLVLSDSAIRLRYLTAQFVFICPYIVARLLLYQIPRSSGVDPLMCCVWTVVMWRVQRSLNVEDVISKHCDFANTYLKWRSNRPLIWLIITLYLYM